MPGDHCIFWLLRSHAHRPTPPFSSMNRSVSRRLCSPSNRISIVLLCCSSKPNADAEIAAPNLGEIWQIGILSSHFEAEGYALVSARYVDATAQAGTDGAAADSGNLDDGRIDQAAGAQDAKTVGREVQGGDGAGHRESSAQLTAQRDTLVDIERTARIGGDGLRTVQGELFRYQQRFAEGGLAMADQIDTERRGQRLGDVRIRIGFGEERAGVLPR